MNEFVQGCTATISAAKHCVPILKGSKGVGEIWNLSTYISGLWTSQILLRFQTLTGGGTVMVIRIAYHQAHY